MEPPVDCSPAALSKISARAFAFLLKMLGIALAALAFYLTFVYLTNRFVALTSAPDLVMIILAASVGLVGAVLWTWREQAVPSACLHYALQVIIRYFLAYVFVTYSLAKFYRTQLYAPPLEWLDTPVGQLTGFQLTWTFFGTSYPYAIFVGLSQLLAAALLCFRRTQLIGALTLLPIISNIVFVNFAYDIPVKLYSSLFLIMTGYLVLTEAECLKAFFWDRTPAPPRSEPEVSSRTRRWFYAGKLATIALIFGFSLWWFERMTDLRPYVEHPVYGIWEVESYAVNGEPPSPQEEPHNGGSQFVFPPEKPRTEWTKLIFEAQFGGNRAVLWQGETRTYAQYAVDADAHTLTLMRQNSFPIFEGHYTLRSDHDLLLSGQMGTDSIEVRLRRTDP